ncbi:MAG: vitamin B12-dependent ribonucleotide reductase, partial [Geminicoccaceae bacterium]
HHDSLSDGEKEQKLKRDDGDAIARIASSGFVRGNLRLLQGGSHDADRAEASHPPIHSRHGEGGTATGAALAVSDSPETAVLDERLAQARLARLKGYEGDPCPGCANFTLVHSGTCLKCDTCGSTTGCS